MRSYRSPMTTVFSPEGQNQNIRIDIRYSESLQGTQVLYLGLWILKSWVSGPGSWGPVTQVLVSHFKLCLWFLLIRNTNKNISVEAVLHSMFETKFYKFLTTEAATRKNEKIAPKISRNSQESTCVRVYF